MFFGHCHRTRFRDSFCLPSVFEMTVYLLTYLLTYKHVAALPWEVQKIILKQDSTVILMKLLIFTTISKHSHSNCHLKKD